MNLNTRMITEIGQLTPGTVFVEVEAYGDGGWFRVNPPLVVKRAPVEYDRAVKYPLASPWSVFVLRVEDEDKPKNMFHMAIPTENGVTITRKPTDHSAFFVHSPEVERKLRELRSLAEYRALIAEL